MLKSNKRLTIAAIALLAAVFIVMPACGGGPGGDSAGRGLILLSFEQAGVDNAVLNTILIFRFSQPVNAATITNASIQIREGPSFGSTVPGVFLVDGANVVFEPQLAALCDQSDSGFKPDLDYRVQVIGFPEQFSIRNTAGQPLDATTTYQFHTRLDTDPEKYADQIPGIGPKVLSTSPDNRSQGVAVVPGNRVEITVSENLNPCTIDGSTVMFQIYEIGDSTVFADVPGTTRKSGFSSTGAVGGDTADQAPLDHTTWGSGGAITSLAGAPQTIPANIQLQQNFSETKIVITPKFGFNPDPLKNASLFPENCLIVVTMNFNISDFGNLSMTPHTFSFTTENLPTQNSQYAMLNDGETPYDKSGTTADVDSRRAPSKVQAYMLFSGDADNGAILTSPAEPGFQPNDGIKDPFEPTADEWLDTGAVPNTVNNSTDGSTAVVWEFQTFRIATGVTVRIIGANPAIILVEGDVQIDTGGRVLVRGDGVGISPQGNGLKGRDVSTVSDAVNPGGRGVAGGGNGGDATRVENNNQNWKYGHDGNAGFGSPDYDPLMPQIDPTPTTDAPIGGGQGGAPVGITTSSPWDGTSSAGGGGGHAEAGIMGQAPNNGTNWQLKLPIRSKGGITYEVDSTGSMPTPEAGSGGGASGQAKDQPWRSSTSEGTGGGSGAAGGGFLDLTSAGDIKIFGTLDAAGGRGGDGERWRGNSGDRGITGGGGGGSGGGIRLLTPNDIVLTGTTLLTAAGGMGGIGARHAVTRPGSIIKEDNDGGAGGNGRIALEDGNSIIAGLGAASVTPAEGANGFYRGVFNANRFQGGGLSPQALTKVFATGPLNPTYTQPVTPDFLAGIPSSGAPGVGKTGIFIEARGFQILADGTPDMGSATDFFSIGFFRDVSIPSLPEWNDGHPSDVAVPADNAINTLGLGQEQFAMLNAQAPAGNGFEFLQVRISMFLPNTVGVEDPGSFIDNWFIQFSHDQ